MSIEAMKQWRESLEELVPDPQCDFGPAYEGMKRRQKEALKSIDQAIAEAEKQKPVAWQYTTNFYNPNKDNGKRLSYSLGFAQVHAIPDTIESLYTHPQPKREPPTPREVKDTLRATGLLTNSQAWDTAEEVMKLLAAHGIKEKNT